MGCMPIIDNVLLTIRLDTTARIFALGFAGGRYSYLQTSNYNKLDILILSSSWYDNSPGSPVMLNRYALVGIPSAHVYMRNVYNVQTGSN